MSERTPAEFTVAEFIEGSEDGSFAPDKGDAQVVWRYDGGMVVARMWLWQDGKVIDTLKGLYTRATCIHWYAKEPCA